MDMVKWWHNFVKPLLEETNVDPTPHSLKLDRFLKLEMWMEIF